MAISRRGDTYYLRRRVPERYRAVETRGYVHVSLRSSDARVAHERAEEIWHEFEIAWSAKIGQSRETVGASEKVAGSKGHSVAYVIDPRFPGGTSSAIAQELRALDTVVRPKIYAVSSQMFKGQEIAEVLEKCLQDLALDIEWDPPSISADTVILHNPAFLKFQSELGISIVTRRLIVVSHENFIRPGGALGFDVDGCIDQIDRAVLAQEKLIAPVSPHNRSTVMDWFTSGGQDFSNWRVTRQDWFNICDFVLQGPVSKPRDLRGRISRPGFEKFPALDDLELCFPKIAERNLILGGDTLEPFTSTHPHWDLVRFRGMGPDAFFAAIDFMVFFTAPSLRESFGRVIAEGIAAGKVVITDVDTAENFHGGAVVATPEQVSRIIRWFIENPDEYARQVTIGQLALQRFSAEAFLDMFRDTIFPVLEDKQ